jgi:hypothetical protein
MIQIINFSQMKKSFHVDKTLMESQTWYAAAKLVADLPDVF